MAKKASTTGQRALVVGVSDYPAPITKLPAVAADVREMAKLLGSKHGVFKPAGVKVLTDKLATRQRVLEALEETLSAAGADDTVFVYLAGHGGIDGKDYFFVAYDTDAGDLTATGIPLTKIKSLFETTPSRRVFLWLDFCHSGGILARKAVTEDDSSAIRRVLEVVKGHGKVIVAACTSAQSAYESDTSGHGFFTHALLRGLQGEAKSAQGEITALSLYEFIDRQVANRRQQPVFFGEMTGRIVLMHYPDRGSSTAKPASKSKPLTTSSKTPPKSNGTTWIMLGEHFLRAHKVRHHSQGSITVEVSPNDAEDEAVLSSLRPVRFGGGMALPFAVNNDAQLVRVKDVETETVGVSGRLKETSKRRFKGDQLD